MQMNVNEGIPSFSGRSVCLQEMGWGGERAGKAAILQDFPRSLEGGDRRKAAGTPLNALRFQAPGWQG